MLASYDSAQSVRLQARLPRLQHLARHSAINSVIIAPGLDQMLHIDMYRVPSHAEACEGLQRLAEAGAWTHLRVLVRKLQQHVMRLTR